MKIAFAARGDDLEAPLDDRLGKACRFLVYDLEAETFGVLDSSQHNGAAPCCADCTAATAMMKAGVSCVVAGHCDPSIHHALCPLGIRLYNSDAPSVCAALEEFRTGRLGADVAACWWG